MKTAFQLIEEHGLTLHGDIEHFAELVRADECSLCLAETEAMERQVNILTDALAESRRGIDAMIALARADERMAMMQLFTDPENQPTQHGTVTLEYMQREIAAGREAANNAYRERNQLVALLSTLFPSGKAKTAIEGWDEAWHECVYIDFPWGQASWHYHTDDEWMFAHLPPYTKVWDGHTTEAKYAAIAAAIRARSNT